MKLFFLCLLPLVWGALPLSKLQRIVLPVGRSTSELEVGEGDCWYLERKNQNSGCEEFAVASEACGPKMDAIPAEEKMDLDTPPKDLEEGKSVAWAYLKNANPTTKYDKPPTDIDKVAPGTLSEVRDVLAGAVFKNPEIHVKNVAVVVYTECQVQWDGADKGIKLLKVGSGGSWLGRFKTIKDEMTTLGVIGNNYCKEKKFSLLACPVDAAPGNKPSTVGCAVENVEVVLREDEKKKPFNHNAEDNSYKDLLAGSKGWIDLDPAVTELNCKCNQIDEAAVAELYKNPDLKECQNALWDADACGRFQKAKEEGKFAKDDTAAMLAKCPAAEVGNTQSPTAAAAGNVAPTVAPTVAPNAAPNAASGSAPLGSGPVGDNPLGAPTGGAVEVGNTQSPSK